VNQVPRSEGSVAEALAHAARLLNGDPALAAQQATEILKVAPHHPAALLLLGMARRAAGNPVAALQVLEPLGASQPSSAATYYELGLALGETGRHESALAALRRALALKPDLPDAWRARADLLLSLSAMTMPHELARAVLAEQIYRAFAILRGHPYPR